ncbi:MAG TPA: 16S rRNA (uracil(1498)-N(3))-methyltransferase [Thermoguttaceae bacterium]|nr:16S rRNA (uracil(1498)-N(3))-methyltransferase [Thermoguttaceae bacterium]
MGERYYVESRIAGDRASLVGGEAHHLVHVMRGRPGDRVTLFDGTGVEFTGEIARIARDEVELTIVTRENVDRELLFRMTLAVALPKGDRQHWLVEKAVELGVSRIVPLRTARSVAEPGAGAARRMARWVIDASKQCGRNRLMEIAPPATWPELLAESTAVPLRLVAHPGGGKDYGEIASRAAGADILAAIGPEGGWTDEEVATARDSGWKVIELGPRILRVETAAVFLASLLSHQTEPRP